MENEDESKQSLYHNIESKERVAAIISTYQLQLRQAEQTLSEFQQKYISQQVQLKQLLKDQQTSAAGLVEIDSNNPQQQLQYDSLMSEIKDLRKYILSNQSSTVSRKPSAQLLQVLRDAVTGSVPPSPLDKGTNVVANPVKPPVQKDANKEELRSQLGAAESRAAQAASRVASLEEELRSYQTYMRESVSNYQRQIQALQQEVKTLKMPNVKLAVNDPKQKSDSVDKKDNRDFKLPPL